jgi:hypothetical protein
MLKKEEVERTYTLDNFGFLVKFIQDLEKNAIGELSKNPKATLNTVVRTKLFELYKTLRVILNIPEDVKR